MNRTGLCRSQPRKKLKKMSDYNEGDLVRLTCGDEAVEGRVTNDCWITVYLTDLDIDNLEADGWTLEVLERAKAPLPTEVGAYLDVDCRVWILDLDGWHVVTDDGGYFFPEGDDDPAESGPLTRLVPEVKS